MSIATVVSRGYGSFGSVNYVPTLGYHVATLGAGEDVVEMASTLDLLIQSESQFDTLLTADSQLDLLLTGSVER